MPVIYLGVNARNMRMNMSQISSDIHSATKSTNILQKAFDGLDSRIASLSRKILGFVSAYKALGEMKDFAKRGIEFNSSIESSRIGMASLITSMVKLEDAQGKTLEGAEKYAVAQGIAADMMKEVQRLGLETTATTQELVEGVQSIMGPAVQAGMALKDIPRFAVVGAQAMQTMGIPLNQMRTELEALLSGNINKSQDLLAPRLGLNKEIINSWREQGTLVENLMKKLQAFELAGQDVAQTWKGLTSNLSEALDVLAGESASGLTENLKSAVREVQDLILVTGEGTPRISDDFKNIAGVLQEIETAIGEGLLEAVRGLIAGVKTLNDIIGEKGAMSFFMDLKAGAVAATAGIAALTVARKASSAAWAQEVLGMKDGLGTLIKLGLARQANAKAAKDEAKAQLEAAQTALENFQATQKTAIAVKGAANEEAIRNAMLRQEAALTNAVTAAQTKYAAAQRNASIVLSAGAAAFRGLKGVLSNIVGMLGGPVGIALTAVSMGFSFLATRQSEAEKAAERHTQALETTRKILGETADEAGNLTHKFTELEKQQLIAARRDLQKSYSSQLAEVGKQVDDLLKKMRNVAEVSDMTDDNGELLIKSEKIQKEFESIEQYAERLETLKERFKDNKLTIEEYQQGIAQLQNEMAENGILSFDDALKVLTNTEKQGLTYLNETYTSLKELDDALKGTTTSAKQSVESSKKLEESLGALNAAGEKEISNAKDAVEWITKRIAQTESVKKATEDEARAKDAAALKELEFSEALAQTALVAAIATSAMTENREEAENMVKNAAANLARIQSFREQAQKGFTELYAAPKGRTIKNDSIDSARNSIQALRREIAEMSGRSAPGLTDIAEKLEGIATAGKKAGMSGAGIAELQEQYKSAFQTKTVQDFNREMLQLEGNTKALQKIEVENSIMKWRQAFQNAGADANETAAAIRRIEEAFGKQEEIREQEEQRKNLESVADFYRELGNLSGRYGASIGYQNQLIEEQKRLWEQLKIPFEDIEERARLMYLQISQDPMAGLERGLRKYGAEYGDMAKQVESFTMQMGNTISSTISDAFMKGKLSAHDFFNSLIGMAAQAASNAFVGQIFSGIGGFFGGGGGKSGKASSKSSGTSFLDTLLSVLPFATGGVASPVGLPHSGGVLTSPTFFHDGLGRAYARGGLSVAGEAGPEVFMPARRMSDGNYGVRVNMGDIEQEAYSGFAHETAKYMQMIAEQNREMRQATIMPNISINVINQTNGQVEAQSSAKPDGNGGFTLDILVTQVEQNIVSRAKAGRSPLMQYQEKAYGMSRAGVLTRGRGRA